MHLFLYVFRSLAILWFLSGASAIGCAGDEYEVKAPAQKSALKGDVEIAEHPSGEKMVTVELEDLPPPRAHGPSYGSYVVWMRPMGLHTMKAGELAYHDDQRLGLMRIITPYESFELLVTAEQDASVAAPGRRVVARRIVQRAR